MRKAMTAFESACAPSGFLAVIKVDEPCTP